MTGLIAKKNLVKNEKDSSLAKKNTLFPFQLNLDLDLDLDSKVGHLNNWHVCV